MNYDLELQKVVNAVKKKEAEKILVQLPEGLKTRSKEIIDEIEDNADAEVTLDGEPVWGACCIPKDHGYDLIIHFGHTKMVETEKVVYIPVKSTLDVYEVTRKAAEEVEGERVGIATTTQHLHKLDEMKEAVKDTGKEPVTNEGTPLSPEAQVLGCRYSAASDIKDDCDSFIFVGTGEFHPQGIANATDSKVITANPSSGETSSIEPGIWEKEKHMRTDKARDAETFGVIYTPYPGQSKLENIGRIKEKLEDKGKKGYEVKLNQITPNKLDHLPFDAFVIEACPRIVLDDWKNYEKPILLPGEI